MAIDKNNSSWSLSPLDGRYLEKTKELREYFSEAALIRSRVRVEVVYLIKLVKFLPCIHRVKSVKGLSTNDIHHSVVDRKLKALKKWSENLSEKDIKRVKQIEKKINHDVKAVEYLVREELVKLSLKSLEQWVHWGITSEDVNNLAYGMMMQKAKDKVVVKEQKEIVKKLVKMAEKYKRVVMPGRTHGQLAVPTTIGKELVVFASRMSKWLKDIEELRLGGKLNGAVGNFNAQVKLYPDKNWLKFSQGLVESLGLNWIMVTTQIEPGTEIVKFLDLVRQFNNVALDMARDMWQYIAFDYLKQKVVKEEVGSSTMPQKVNPIDFENAEGNLELANGMLMVLSNKLPVSRMQRDLSDSTVKRNLGVGMGYSLVAYKSLVKGLNKIEPNKRKLKLELEDHPEMLAEAIQLLLKTKGKEKAYEKVKAQVRGGIRPLKSVKDLIDSEAFASEELVEVGRIVSGWRVKDYVGLASDLVKKFKNKEA